MLAIVTGWWAYGVVTMRLQHHGESPYKGKITRLENGHALGSTHDSHQQIEKGVWPRAEKDRVTLGRNVRGSPDNVLTNTVLIADPLLHSTMSAKGKNHGGTGEPTTD